MKHTWGWEMAQGQISQDPRYKALKSMSEKKQAFSDYCQQKKKVEEDERRKKDREVKENFFLMLRDNKEINPKMSWRKAQVCKVWAQVMTNLDTNDLTVAHRA